MAGGRVKEKPHALPCLRPRRMLTGACGSSGCSAGAVRAGSSTRHALAGRAELPPALSSTWGKEVSFSISESGPSCLP